MFAPILALALTLAAGLILILGLGVGAEPAEEAPVAARGLI